MLRKVIAGILIIISVIMLGLSLAGIIMIWTYNQPLTMAVTNKLQAVDGELAQAQTALQNANLELQRTQRIVEAAEQAMTSLKSDFAQVKTLFGDVNGSLDTQLIPGLQATRQRIDEAATALKDLRAILTQLNVFSFVTVPGDKLLSDIIASAGSLDLQISNVQALIKKASTMSGDASYLLGADFSETKNSLKNFLTVVDQYDGKIKDWRAQVAMLLGALPYWIKNASIVLTVFLAWFGFSQISLLLHGLAAWHRRKPLAVPVEAPMTDVEI
jgi:DNA-binding transcriptional MerR regulator